MSSIQEEKSQKQPQPVVQSVATSGSLSRPRGMTIAAIVGIILSILAIFNGILVALSGIELILIGAVTTIFVTVFIAIGIIALIGFILILKMNKTGWKLATVFGFVLLLMQIVLFLGGGILINVIWAAIIGYIWKKKDLFT